MSFHIDQSMVGLKKSRHWLCQEWAAAEGVSPAQAAAEVEAMLQEGRGTPKRQ